MGSFKESDFKPYGKVQVRFIRKVEHTFEVIADVPFDYGYGKGTKRETVAKGFNTKEGAVAGVAQVKSEHPDYTFVRAVKRDKSL